MLGIAFDELYYLERACMTQLLAMGAAGREAIKLLPLDVQVCRQLAEKPSSFFHWASRYIVSWQGSHQAISIGRSDMPSAGREAIKLLPLDVQVSHQLVEKPSSIFRWTSRYPISW
jgi:uncharacterized protein involved in tolerance to divalent cations